MFRFSRLRIFNILSSVSVAAFLFLPIPLYKEVISPVPQALAAEPGTFPAALPTSPVNIAIPSINLNSSIEPMGLDGTGALDVPDGKTNYVGWYAAGTLPGNLGSAVFDAHVYAAFKNLNKVKLGQDIYVTMDNGVKLHFVITEKKVLPLNQISTSELYNEADGKELHLITCAGTFIKSINTYDKRLLVYATLVEN